MCAMDEKEEDQRLCIKGEGEEQGGMGSGSAWGRQSDFLVVQDTVGKSWE